MEKLYTAVQWQFLLWIESAVAKLDHVKPPRYASRRPDNARVLVQRYTSSSIVDSELVVPPSFERRESAGGRGNHQRHRKGESPRQERRRMQASARVGTRENDQQSANRVRLNELVSDPDMPCLVPERRQPQSTTSSPLPPFRNACFIARDFSCLPLIMVRA